MKKTLCLILVGAVCAFFGPLVHLSAADSTSRLEVCAHMKNGTNFIVPHGVKISYSNHKFSVVKGGAIYLVEQKTDKFGRILFHSDIYDDDVNEVDGRIDVSPDGRLSIQFNLHRASGGVVSGQMSQVHAGVYEHDTCECNGNSTNWNCQSDGCNLGKKCPPDPTDGPHANFHCYWKPGSGEVVVIGDDVIFPELPSGKE